MTSLLKKSDSATCSSGFKLIWNIMPCSSQQCRTKILSCENSCNLKFFFFQIKSFIILAVLRRSVQRICGAHLRIIAPGQHNFFRKNVAATASCWQRYCIRFDQPKIWTSELPLQKGTRQRSTNIEFLYPFIVDTPSKSLASFHNPTGEVRKVYHFFCNLTSIRAFKLLTCGWFWSRIGNSNDLALTKNRSWTPD